MGAPIIVLCGEAGSGKDTVGTYLSKTYRGVDIGLADPMKRIAHQLFGFTEDQLFGPSANRNQVDHRFDTHDGPVGMGDRNLQNAERQLEVVANEWFPVLFPGKDRGPIDSHFALWFGECVKKAEDGLTPRFVLQTMGTEFGREIDPEVWSRYAVRTARLLLGAEHEYTRWHGLIRNLEKRRPFDLVTITDGRFANEIMNVKTEGGTAVHIVREANLSKEAMTAGKAGHISEMGLSLVPEHFYDYELRNDGSIEHLLSRADFLAHTVMSLPRLIGRA